MTFATFAIANLLVSASALALAVGLRFRGAIEVALAAAVIAVSQVTASILIAGVVLRQLNATSLLLINAALSSAVLLIVRPSISSPREWPTLGGVIRAGGGAARAHPLAAALAALAAAALGWRVVLAIVLPPYAFDALSYHLLTVAHWISRGRIEESPLNDCCAGYPAGGEAVFTWPAILLDGESVVDAVQIGFVVLGALAVAGLARVAGLRRSSAVTAAALFALTPIVLAQANTNYVDVMSAATFLVALFFVAAYLSAHAFSFGRGWNASSRGDEPRPVLLGAAGLAAGLCLGVKLSGILLVGTLALLVCGHVVLARTRRRLDGRAACIATAAFLLPTLTLGGFWYGHNALDHDNPVYPFRVALGGREIFAGRLDPTRSLEKGPPEFRDEPAPVQIVHSWSRDLLFWKNSSYSHDQRLGGLGPLWSYLGAVLTLAFAVACWRSRRVLLVNLLAPIGVIFALQPYRWWSRFTIALAAIGAIVVAHYLERLGHSKRGVGLASAVVILVTTGAAIASYRVNAGSGAPILNPTDVVRIAAKPRSERTTGQVFYPDYAWIDGTDEHARIGIDLAGVHFVSALTGITSRRTVLALPPIADLGGFISRHRIEYVVVARKSQIGTWAKAASREGDLRPLHVGRSVSVYVTSR